VPGNYDLRTALVFCFEETVAESHQMLVEAYGEHALDKSQCFEWFKKFKSGDFNMRNEENHRNVENYRKSLKTANCKHCWMRMTQTQQQLADQLNVTREASICLKSMGKIQKIGKWVPHELNERQQENRKTTCEMLLARQKKVISPSNCDWRWKVDIFWES